MIGPQDIHSAAHLFAPERLTIARELRGLTRQELAEKIGRTPSAVSQFEGGRSRPDGQTIARLMLALGVPAGALAAVAGHPPLSVIPIEHCHFRSLRSAAQRDRRRLLAKGSMLCMLLEWLEREVQLPAEQITRLAPMIADARDATSIDDLAAIVRREWGLGLGPIGNMVNLLERNGVVVIPIDEACREVDAFSLWSGRRPCVFLVMGKGSSSRTRMDAAHELGHLVLHADATGGSPELERQAQAFGGAFLMPKESFSAEAPRRLNWEHMWEIKRRWKVSAAAILRRSFELGTISEASYRRGFVQLGQAGLRTAEPAEPPGETPVALRKALDVVAGDWSLEQIAADLGVASTDLQNLVSAECDAA